MTPQQKFADLMTRVRQGDDRAIADLVQTFRPRVRRAARLYGRWSAEQARFDSEDVAQSVFLRLFAGLSDDHLIFKTPDELAIWLVRVARTRLVDRIRHEKGRGRADRPRELADEINLGAAETTEPDPAEVAEAADLLHTVGAMLPVADLIVLRYWLEGHAPHEIGRMTNQSADAIRKRLFRTKELLRRRLAD